MELEYEGRVAPVGMATDFRGSGAARPCDATRAAAPSSRLPEQREAVSPSRPGALTNLAEAVRRDQAEFRALVERVVFIGDTDPSRQSYNAALDPAALKVLLGSGVEIVLVGQACYPPPEWVEALFREDPPGGGMRGVSTLCDGADGTSTAAVALRALGSLDPYSMCYDPLALLFHLQPGAFSRGATPIPVRVSGDVGTADGWRFERCGDSTSEEPHGYVIEPSGL